MLKRTAALLLALTLLFSLTACGREQMAETDPPAVFTDSSGRTLSLPANIEHIAVSGPLAQMYIFALAPDMLVGLSSKFPESAADRIDDKYLSLPVLGQLYGGKGELNLESLLASGAQIVIDIGETKDGIAGDLDALSEQTGIPFIHISASLFSSGNAFRMLGELLGLKARAETLAAYCETVYNEALRLSEIVEKKSILYCLGDNGTNVIAAHSYHSEVLDLLADNLAVLDSPSSKGTGNESDIEQLLVWNPEIIIFAPESVYDIAGSDSVWQQLSAISSGRYYEVPFDLQNWMGFPPGVQRYLGILWLSELLYPGETSLNFYEEVEDFYELFYHCQLSEEELAAILIRSL